MRGAAPGVRQQTRHASLYGRTYVALDPLWMKRLGDAFTTAVAVAVLLQMVTVFPFDFAPRWESLETPVRILLGVGCVGAAIGVIANLAMVAANLDVWGNKRVHG